MGFYRNIGGILHFFEMNLVRRFPVIKGNEFFKSDLDFYIGIGEELSKSNLFGEGIVTDFGISGSHLEFAFHGIPVAVFNMATPFYAFEPKLSMDSQALLDIKEGEIADWESSYKKEPYATIILELGSADSFEKDEHSFAVSAQSTNDYRYVIHHFGF